jgi:hypothetical protein
MADNRHDTEAHSLPLQGPHRRPDPRRPAEPEVPPMRLRLRPGTFAVEVTRSGTVLGRHSSADVRLPLPDVSRQHCRFVCESGCWQVVDLDSLNGIFLNGQPVRQAELHDHDQLRIGGFVFEVDLSGEPAPANSVRTIAHALPLPDDGGLRRAS